MFRPSSGSQFLFFTTYWGMDKNLQNATKILKMLWSYKNRNVCAENSTTQLQYPVQISNSFVATSRHSMFINWLSHWRFIPTSNYVMLNAACVVTLLTAFVPAVMLHLHAVRDALWPVVDYMLLQIKLTHVLASSVFKFMKIQQYPKAKKQQRKSEWTFSVTFTSEPLKLTLKIEIWPFKHLLQYVIH